MTETAWMGRYRQLVATIVLHGNNVSRVMPLRTPMLDGIALNQPEWQILEYLLENEQDQVKKFIDKTKKTVYNRGTLETKIQILVFGIKKERDFLWQKL